MTLQKRLEIIRLQLHSLLPIRMQILQSLRMLLMNHLPLFPIPPRKNTTLSALIQLPLFDILGNILPIRPESVPYVDRDKVAMQVHESDVEIEADLGLIVFVEGDGGGHGGSCEGECF